MRGGVSFRGEKHQEGLLHMASDFTVLARACGFDAAAPLKVSALRFLPEVRAMCAANRCRTYDKSWSCPPATGTLEELQARCSAFQSGLLAQTVGAREDPFDFEAIQELQLRHAENFATLTKRLKQQLPALWPMGIAACRRCEVCTWPDAPCRFPEEVFPPMEACGLLVSEVCQACGLPYYYGSDHISFTSCWLF